MGIRPGRRGSRGAPRESMSGRATETDLVTGAFSYSGSRIAELLIDSGREVRTLTHHPNREHPLRARVQAAPYRFDDPVALARSLEGITTLYNTYWVRFERGRTTFADAVASSRTAFEAARRAGHARGDVIMDAAGPDTMSFEELVRAIREAVGRRTPILHAPPAAMAALARALGLVVRDVVLTADEIRGLTAGLVASHHPALGHISFSAWLHEHESALGDAYANELG